MCFWQYFGSSLQLTPHLHLLVPEAHWRVDGDVVPLPPPSDADVTAVLQRVLRLARKDFADVDVPFPDDDFEGLQLRALQKPLPLALPHRPSRRLATAHGFSLHADTAVHGNDRQGLERLCRYRASWSASSSAECAPSRTAQQVSQGAARRSAGRGGGHFGTEQASGASQ